MAEITQFIFFDFEMLCSNRGMDYNDMEAIRLGAVKYDLATKTVSYFDQYIKPRSNKPLSAFCKRLTGITDDQLADAATFPAVLEEFLTWVGGIKRSRFFSWSKSDMSRLEIDSKSWGIPDGTLKKIKQRYVDFQDVFTKRVSKENMSVENALALYDLTFVGIKHNPMFDAYNTLCIYLQFLNQPEVTDRIMIKQFILQKEMDPVEMNATLKEILEQDTTSFFKDLQEVTNIIQAKKTLKKLRRIVTKYNNILHNRSGMFTQKVIQHVKLLVIIYDGLMQTYDEHLKYRSKTMYIDEHLYYPIKKLAIAN
ncbi:3'-5' exonuclease [Bacillaceae bacterium S4-13-56]